MIIELTSHTTPCTNIQPCFQDGDYSRISQKAHPGWSRLNTRILQPGYIQIGDKVTIIKESSDD